MSLKSRCYTKRPHQVGKIHRRVRKVVVQPEKVQTEPRKVVAEAVKDATEPQRVNAEFLKAGKDAIGSGKSEKLLLVQK